MFNSRKAILPLYIKNLITKNTTPENHISQKAIADIINKKYGIEVDRKTVSRIVHTLEDEGLGICSSKEGVWYDSDREWNFRSF